MNNPQITVWLQLQCAKKRDAIRRPLQIFTYKHIVRLRDDVISSFGCFIFNFMKASSAVNYLHVHTDDGGVKALIWRQTVDHCRVCILSQNAAKSPTRR